MATTAAFGLAPHSITENTLERIRTGSRFNHAATAIVSVLVAISLAAAAVLIVEQAATIFDADDAVGLAATAAAGLCGVLLIIASLIGSKGDR